MLVFGHLEGAHTIKNLLPVWKIQTGHSNPSLQPLQETVYKVTKYKLRFMPHLTIHSEINQKYCHCCATEVEDTHSLLLVSVFHQSARQGNFPQCPLNCAFHGDILLPRWGMSCIFHTRPLRTEHTEAASGGPACIPDLARSQVQTAVCAHCIAQPQYS